MQDYLFAIGGRVASAAAQMVMLLLVAQVLAPGQLATLLAVYSLASVLAALGDLGLGTLAMKERTYGDRATSDQAVRLSERLALATGISGVIVLGVGTIYSPDLLACAPLLAWAPLERVAETRGLTLVADGKVLRVAALTAGRRLCALGLFLLTAERIAPDAAFGLSLTVTSALAYAAVRRWASVGQPGDVLHGYRDLLRAAFPYTATSLSGQLRNFDVPLVTAAMGGTAAAAYGLGARLASPALLVFSAVSGLVLVRVRKMADKRVRRLIAASLLIPMTVAAVAILAVPITAPILGRAVNWVDAEATLLMVVVSVSYLFAGVGIVLGSMCVAHDLQQALMRVNIVTVLTSLSLVALASTFGRSALVAAAASAGCYLAQAALLALLVIRRRRLVTRGE